MTSSILPSSYTLKSTTEICSLWSNYGSISRLTVSHPTTKSLILKSILPPPTSSSDDESHIRKLISYRVERYFYTHLSPHLTTLPSTKVATPIAINDSSGELLLEDLSLEYPITCYGSLDPVATTATLKWLAGFHATFWAPEISPSPSLNIGSPIPEPLAVTSPNTTNGIWRRGGYWYLSTRTEELNSLLDNWHSDEKYLNPWIKDVDKRIQDEKKEWKTLVHGDVKGANIFLSSNPKKSTNNQEEVKAALYDFQYCGIATPAVDLVYFIGTTVDRRLLGDLDQLLRTYYDELSRAYEIVHDGKKLEEETGYSYDALREQWDIAVVDWMRFMAGWGFWGNWRWVRECAKAAVKKWEDEGRIPVKGLNDVA
ncbi:hypothetical protein TWF281_011770 [Arthrobotrys megalospora]